MASSASFKLKLPPAFARGPADFSRLSTRQVAARAGANFGALLSDFFLQEAAETTFNSLVREQSCPGTDSRLQVTQALFSAAALPGVPP